MPGQDVIPPVHQQDLPQAGALPLAGDALFGHVRLALALFGVPTAFLCLKTELGYVCSQYLGRSSAPSEAEVEAIKPLLDMPSGQIITDAAHDPRLYGRFQTKDTPLTRFFACAPIMDEGRTLGSLCLIDKAPRPDFDAQRFDALRQYAGSLGHIMRLESLSKAYVATIKGHEKTQRRIEMMEEVAGVGYWHLNLNTTHLTWSNGVYAIHGVSPDTYSPSLETAKAWYHSDDHKALEGFLETIISSHGSREIKLRIVRADGALRHVLSRGRVSLDRDGRPESIFGVFRDVTDPIETHERLQASETRYKLLANNANDLVLECNLTGQIVFASPSSARITGLSPQMLLGKLWCDFLHKDDAPAVISAIRALITSGQSKSREPLEYRYITPQGEILWFEGRPSLIYAEDTGKPRGFITIIRDISYRKTAEAELKAALDAARSANEAKSQFLANMSHEIRTPLTSILGYAGLVETGGALKGDNALFISRISTAGRHLLELVNDILDMARFEAGQVRLSAHPTHLKTLALELIAQFHTPAEQKGLSLELHFDPDLPDWLQIDDTKLAQVLSNLIGNACKFTVAGEIEITFLKNGPPEAPTLRVEVRDTGPGLSAGEITQLFKRFQQLDSGLTRTHGGSGLGLAICREIITLMEGRLGVTSEPGIGSTFWFEIACVSAEPQPVADTLTQDLRARHLKVLLVDDHDVNRDLVKAMITPFGLEVCEAKSGAQALLLCQAQSFDLILMDIHMPGMDGVETSVRIARECPANEKTPIIALTALSRSRLPKGYEAARFCDILSKPLDPKTLQNLLLDLRAKTLDEKSGSGEHDR